MTLIELLAEHPYLATLVALCILGTLVSLARFLFQAWNRFLRHFNIRSQGWPPPHCDADGDFKPKPDDEE